MSELIDNGGLDRKDLLKHLILQLHVGTAPAQVQRQLVRMLGQVPYGLVVEVEQELMADGMPPRGGDAPLPPPRRGHGGRHRPLRRARGHAAGHPVHTFKQENAALVAEIAALADAVRRARGAPGRRLARAGAARDPRAAERRSPTSRSTTCARSTCSSRS